MKTSQELVLLILKFMHNLIFKDYLTIEESEWKKRFDAYNLHTKRNLRIEITPEGKTILAWTSYTGNTVGCYVNQEWFMLAETGVYDGGCIFDPQMYFNNDFEKVEIINGEIAETESFLHILTRAPLRLS